MGGKAKRILQKQKLIKDSTLTIQRKREEREIKLRLRKEKARQRNYESNEELLFAKELLEKGYIISVVDGDGEVMYMNVFFHVIGGNFLWV